MPFDSIFHVLHFEVASTFAEFRCMLQKVRSLNEHMWFLYLDLNVV